MKIAWWKYLTVVLFLYAVIGGMIIEIPDLERLHETLRNLFFHVPMWFAMIFILLMSFVYSLRYLRHGKVSDDVKATEAVNVGLLFGIMGFTSGMLWGNYSWGELSAWLINEPRSLASIIAMLFYLAYMVLRGSIDEEQKRARVSAVYNIFAYVMYLVFILIIPRMVQSLHPGVGGNPGFNVYDTDNNLKLVLYPAWIAFMMVAWWLLNIRVRYRMLRAEILQNT